MGALLRDIQMSTDECGMLHVLQVLSANIFMR